MKKTLILYIPLFLLSAIANAQQWVSFSIHPLNSILFVDGERHILKNGFIEMLLPLGNHTYSVQSPYFENLTDTFELKDDARRDITVVIQSAYGYLQLHSSETEDRIYIDQCEVGSHSVRSIRYKAGIHRLTVLRDTLCLCDQGIEVPAGEKRLVDVDSMGIKPFPWDPARWLVPLGLIGPNGELLDTTALGAAHVAMAFDSAAVNVTSNVDCAEIRIDNCAVGTTPLVVSNLVANRKYLITLHKPGYRTASMTVVVSAKGITEAYIKMKKQ